ncbi:MAG: ARMT1-like domain-containing protein [Proteobacteria bacterium]|nr:ARMT1-like domain-containing protein [Pseudomonadota bacterium]
MRLKPDCIPCFFKQASIVANILKADELIKLELYKGISKIISEKADINQTPAFLATQIHEYIKEFFKNQDPFRELKKASNDKMLQLYNEFINLIRESNDHLRSAIILSTIGNLIDYSLYNKVELDEIKDKFNSFTPAIFDYEKIKEALTKGSKILFITDNSGEIVLDKLLIELFYRKGKKVIVASKEKPILNDATVEDVRYVGIEKFAKVIGIGNGQVGTPYPSGNVIFDRAIQTADVIISKGQANFETLYELDRPVCFLFVVKCQAVASFLNVNEGSPIIMMK